MLRVQQRLHRLLPVPAFALVRLAPGFLERIERELERLAAGHPDCGEDLHRLLQRLEENSKTWRIDGRPCQAALRHLLQQATGRMILVAEKTGVVEHQPQQRRLERAHRLLDRQQQPRVAGDVLHHQVHHFQAERLAGTGCRLAHLLAQRRDPAQGCGRTSLALQQPRHDLVNLLHLLQGFERRRYGDGELGGIARRGAVLEFALELFCERAGAVLELAGQQSPELAHVEQRAGRQGATSRGPARRCGRVAAGVHRVAGGDDALVAQQLRQFGVQARQFRPEIFTQMLHPAVAHAGGDRALHGDRAQSAHEDVGPQRIAIGLDQSQALRCADQRRQLLQFELHCLRHRLLGAHHVDAFLQLLFTHQLQRVEAQRRRAGLGAGDRLREFGQQRLRIRLAQRFLMLHQDPRGFGQQLALLRLVHHGCALRHRFDAARHQPLHQRVTAAGRFLDAGTVQRRAGRVLRKGGHGGGGGARLRGEAAGRHFNAL